MQVKDNDGAFGRDTVKVTVNPAPVQEPTEEPSEEPVQEQPTQENPAEQNPTEETPNQQNPTRETPNQEAPNQGKIRLKKRQTNKTQLKKRQLNNRFNNCLNILPSAEAGTDKTVAYPSTSTELDASGSEDVDGAVSDYNWKMISGPSEATFENPNAAVTGVSNLEAGEYVFEVTITDNKGAKSTAKVHISVVNNLKYEEKLSLYPNPAKSDINIQLNNDTMGLARITVYNTSGMVVQRLNTQKTQPILKKNISISNLQTGVYYVEVIIGNTVKKIMKFVKN